MGYSRRLVTPAQTVTESEARFDALRRRVGRIAAPIAFVVLFAVPFPGLSPQAHALAAITAFVVIAWVTEAIPLAAAALLGPALTVVFGVAPADEALAPFADPLIFLFLGGFMLAGALTRQGFDRRAALWLVSRRFVAGSPARAMIAVAGIGFGFSMWISNTATTAMLIPVALGLHATMKAVIGDDPQTRQALDRYGGGLCLILAYSASLGGLATPVGTAPNVIAVGMLEAKLGVHLDFLQWMSFGLPVGLVMLVLTIWLFLRRFPAPVARIEGLTAEVDRQLAALGPISKGERRAVGVFALAIVGWLAPSLLRLGLGDEHPLAAWAKGSLDEGVVAMTCAGLLFWIPADSDESLLTWEDAQQIDWGTLFLLGGGLALGRLTFETKLAHAIGTGILDLVGPLAQHPLGLSAAAVLLVLALTELTSNTATATMMLPVLMGVAQAAGFDAVPTALAVTLASSFAFMLPVSTPPNAIAYGTKLIRIDTMVRVGLQLDLIGYVVLMVMTIVWLPLVLG